MDNEKRILLAVALSIAVLFCYQYLFTPPAKKAPPAAVQTVSVLTRACCVVAGAGSGSRPS